MKRVCVPLAEGFEEIEALTIVDVLRRASVEVKTAGLKGKEVKGSHEIVVKADMTLDEALSEEWDCVALPGGMPGSTNLRDDDRVGTLLSKTAEAGGVVAAICAAPIVLARWGLLNGKAATSYPGFGDQLTGAQYKEERVVKDKGVITSRGPGTAMEFALALVEELLGSAKAAELKQALLAR